MLPEMSSPELTLLGCGLWGRNILRDLVRLGCRVAVVDPDPAAREAAHALGAARVGTERDGVGAPDGIVVATPAATHAAVVEPLLELGCPVFVEKPLATDAESATRLAARAPGTLFVMHVWRYHPSVEALAELVRSGEIGQVEWLRSTRVNWTSPRHDVDPVWTLAPHDLSIALALLGTLPPPRSASAECQDGRPVGLVGVLGRPTPLTEGPSVVIEVSTRHAEKRREVRVHGRKGVAWLTSEDEGCLHVARGSGAQARVERRPVGREPALLRELRSFVEHLSGGPPPVTSAREGADVVRALCALRRLAGI